MLAQPVLKAFAAIGHVQDQQVVACGFAHGLDGGRKRACVDVDFVVELDENGAREEVFETASIRWKTAGIDAAGLADLDALRAALRPSGAVVASRGTVSQPSPVANLGRYPQLEVTLLSVVNQLTSRCACSAASLAPLMYCSAPATWDGARRGAVAMLPLLPGVVAFGLLYGRGVPEEAGPTFWWEGPDGSRVLAYSPAYGYSADLGPRVHEVIERWRELTKRDDGAGECADRGPDHDGRDRRRTGDRSPADLGRCRG